MEKEQQIRKIEDKIEELKYEVERLKNNINIHDKRVQNLVWPNVGNTDSFWVSYEFEWELCGDIGQQFIRAVREIN